MKKSIFSKVSEAGRWAGLAWLLFFLLKWGHIDSVQGQLYLGISSAVLGVTGLLLFRDSPTRIVYSSVLFVALLPAWNIWYTHYVSATGFTGDIFRTTYHNLYAPVYGTPLLSDKKAYLFFFIVGLVLLVAFRQREKWQLKGWMWGMAYILLIAVFNISSLPEFYSEGSAHIQTFAQGLPYFENTPELLSSYSNKMAELGVHNSHYPPGNLLLTSVFFSNGGRIFFFAILVLSAFMQVLFFYKLILLGGLKVNVCMPFFLFIPQLLFFPVIDLVIIPSACITAASYFLLQQQANTKTILWQGLLAGVFFSTGLFFSFIVIAGMLPVIMLAVLFIVFKMELRNTLLIRMAAALLTVLIIYLLLYQVYGFSIVDCLNEGIKNNRRLMNPAFDDLTRWLLRSSGNIIAYAFSTGVLIIISSFYFLQRMIKGRQVLELSIFLTLAFLSFSGLFFLETERIWFFITPFILLAFFKTISGDEWKAFRNEVFIFQLVFTVGQALRFAY